MLDVTVIVGAFIVTALLVLTVVDFVCDAVLWFVRKFG